GGEKLTSKSLIIDTELIRYKWTSLDGNYPDWQKLIPTDFNCLAHFDTVEAIKAVNSLKALADSKGYSIDLTIGNGKMIMANPDDRGQADISADTDGESFVRLNGSNLAEALKACGGMVDFKLSSPLAPTLFSTNGYQIVVMPMITDKAQEYAKKQAKAQKAEAKPAEVAEPVKAKHSRAKQPVKTA
ncbi:MAG TPA: hypothetical protein G4O12_08665, partial [Dehalococcoidia bacterium]|nr:hypothetical protein [Dehalococcoidia bacterium]